MRENMENTPPHNQDIDAEDAEEVILDDEEDFPPEDDELDMEEDDELQEVTLEELEAMVNAVERDDSILTFAHHTAPVFACSLHPTQDLAVTGGEDDKAFVWSTKTAEIVHEVTGHKDTIIAAGFSFDGTYLATGDMAGEIQVFKLLEGLKKVWEFSMGDMCWMRWHPSANVLMAGAESGEVYVWKIPSGDCKILPGQGHKCETADLSYDGKKIFAGYGDGSLRLWDIKSTSTLMEVTPDSPMGHQDNISAVSCDFENPIYMSGGEDSKLLFLSNNGPVGAVETAGPVECVAFSPSPELKVAASGTLHGQIAIWDYSKQTMRALCDHPQIDDGVTILKWLPEQTLLAGTIQGNIFAFDGRSGAQKYSILGHAAEVYAMQYDPKEQILLTVSEDNTAKIFKCPPGASE